MKNIYYLFILLNVSTFAKFSLTGANTEEFPKVKMGFTATTVNGNPIENIRAENFTVVENGINLTNTVEVLCEESTELKEASILLILDQSKSMRPSEKDPTNRWEWLVDGVKSFLESIEFEGRTEVGMTMFGKDVRLLHPFTQDRAALEAAVEGVDPNGTATFYNPPFIDPEFGAAQLLSERPIDVRRVAIFLTDGLNSDTEQNRYNEIIDELNNQGVNVYTISLLMNMTPQLARVSQETGGRSFEVFTRENLSEIYQLIALDIQNVQICNLSYISPFSCDDSDREREVVVTFDQDPDNQPDTRSYFAPENSVAQFDIENTTVSFGDPDPNNSTSRTITIGVETAPLTVDNLFVSPDTFFEVTDIYIDGEESEIGATAQPGSTLEIGMRFTQGNIKDFRQAILDIQGEFCGPKFDLVGGFSQVFLINPKDDLTSSACDDILIEWAGVDENTDVLLSYQRAGDPAWIPINNGNPVRGGSYLWQVPDGGEYKIRVERPEENAVFWTQQFSSTGNAITTGITVNDEGSFVFTSGFYEETLQIDGESFSSDEKHDLFLSKFDRDGNLVWNKIHRGPGDDSTSGIAKLPNGDIVICGTVENGINFAPINPFMQFDELPYAFVALYDAETGDVKNVKVFGARGINQTTEAWGMGVRYNPDSERIELVGQYRGPLYVVFPPFDVTLPFDPQNENLRPFQATLDTDLNITNVESIGFDLNQFESFSEVSSDGSLYQTAKFEATNNPFGLQSQGKFDSWVSKSGIIEASQDENQEFFVVEQPELVFNEISVDLGDVMLSESDSRNIPAILTNPGDLPITIENFEFSNTEFALSTLLPDQILPQESIDIEFSFTPQDLGQRSGTFTLFGECAAPIAVELTGNGTCRGEAEETFDVGAGVVQLTKSVTVNSLFRNPTNQAISIEPVIINDPNDEFEVFINNAGTLINSITVEPFGEVDIEIEFTPSAAGNRTATIDYQVIDVCENVTTDIFGEGIESSVVANADEIINRIQTVNQGKITLENLAPLEVTVTDISLIQNNSNYFELQNIQDEYVISANSSIEIDYIFYPQTEGEFTTGLRIETSDGKVNEATEITGTGLYPNLEISFECPQDDVTQGQSGNATLILTNTSDLETVRTIDIVSNTAEYRFDGDVAVNPTFELDPGETRNINVVFSPIQPNPVNAVFEITADAAIGDNQSDTYPASEEFDQDFNGCAVEPSTDIRPLVFGDILVCGKPGEGTVEVVNTSNSPLIINPEDFSLANDEGVFLIDIPTETIELTNNGDNISIDVIFDPQDDILYEDVLTINNNQGRLIQFNLTGAGEYIDLTAELENEFIKLDGITEDDLTISANVNELALGNIGWNIENLTVRISYNQNVVEIKDEVIDLSGQGIIWETEFGDGFVDVVAQNALNPPLNGELFDLSYTVYLSNELESDINYKVYYEGCETPDSEPATVNIEEFCASKYRLIDPNVTPFIVKGPNPNPITQNTEIEFSVPYDGKTKIEIYDMLGNLVSVQYDNFTQEGLHKTTLNLKEIPNGVYFLKISSLLNSDTKQIMISK